MVGWAGWGQVATFSSPPTWAQGAVFRDHCCSQSTGSEEGRRVVAQLVRGRGSVGKWKQGSMGRGASQSCFLLPAPFLPSPFSPAALSQRGSRPLCSKGGKNKLLPYREYVGISLNLTGKIWPSVFKLIFSSRFIF